MAADEISCTICGHETRKSMYDMRRHWDSKHKDRIEKGEEVTYKLKATNTNTLAKYGFCAKQTNKSKDESGEADNETAQQCMK